MADNQSFILCLTQKTSRMTEHAFKYSCFYIESSVCVYLWEEYYTFLMDTWKPSFDHSDEVENNFYNYKINANHH